MIRLHCAAARLALLCLSLGCSGCAVYPEGFTDTQRVLLDMRMTMRGAIDPNAYYLFVIDTLPPATRGPEVIAPFTQFLGNGRATGQYTHYIEYHNSRFELFRDEPESEDQTTVPAVALGPPFFYDDSGSTGTLSATLSLEQLKDNTADPDPTELQLNFITVNEIVLPGEIPINPRQTDGIGPVGTSFLSLPVQNGLIVQNEAREGAGEIVAGEPLPAALDLVDFRVAVRQGS